MPARNGTGPAGMGPRTGRGMGNCQPVGTTAKNIGAPSTTGSWPINWGRSLWRAVGNGFLGFRRGRRNNRF